MTLSTSQTYYLLRAKSTTIGDGPYVGVSPEGADCLVPDHVQARRFATLDTAESFAGSVKETFGEFEIEVRIAA